MNENVKYTLYKDVWYKNRYSMLKNKHMYKNKIYKQAIISVNKHGKKSFSTCSTRGVDQSLIKFANVCNRDDNILR